jgi:hypothetical protein
MASSDAVLSARPITLMISSERKGRGDAEQRPAEGCLPTSAEYYSVLVQVPQQVVVAVFISSGAGGSVVNTMSHRSAAAAAAAANVAPDLEMRDCAAAVGEDIR